MNRPGDVGIIFYVNKGNIVLAADRIVAIDFERPFGGVSDPGAFND